MKLNSASVQPDLFDQNGLHGLPMLHQKEQLALLIEVLLREIAAALASGEISNNQDHG